VNRGQFLEDGAAVDYDRARVVVLPAPYEGTVSYGAGAARGPQAILDASEQLELFDEELGYEPFRCGIWTAPALALSSEVPERAVDLVAARVGALLDDRKWVVTLGGEHSITAGAVRAAVERYPGLHVVQLDAHADLRDSYQKQRFSHACAMARCLEHAPVHAVGIRSYSRQEVESMRAAGDRYRVVHAWETGSAGWIERVLGPVRGTPVYLTIDVDAFDPSIVPATGTPEPGGLAWRPALELLAALFHTAHVVAADAVELAPIPGLSHPDFTVARLVHKLIGWAAPGLTRFGVAP
jgi:agmatinase